MVSSTPILVLCVILGASCRTIERQDRKLSKVMEQTYSKTSQGSNIDLPDMTNHRRGLPKAVPFIPNQNKTGLSNGNVTEVGPRDRAIYSGSGSINELSSPSHTPQPQPESHASEASSKDSDYTSTELNQHTTEDTESNDTSSSSLPNSTETELPD
ncbi:unnamed protein product, partial [Allacma fusca]